MRFLFLFLFMFFSQGIQSAFLPSTDDIPLMDGIALTDTDDFSFDTPAGHILTLIGETKIPHKDVLSFYQKTLTSLGWYADKQTFKRDNDTLNISFPTPDTVRFDITLTGKSL